MESFHPKTLDELLEIRPRTDRVAGLLHTRLTRHLETLTPLFDPQRVLGKASGTGRIAWMEKTLTEFKALYQQFGRPFRLPEEFDPEMLNDASARLALHPWEYEHEVQSGEERRRVKMISPTSWVLSYVTEYSPEQMKAALTTAQAASIHRFVLHTLLLQMVIARSPRLVELLRDLRFEVSSVPCPELRDLPLVTVRFALPSYRPDDALIFKATKLNGISEFIELVNVEELRRLPDSLRQELESALA